MESGRLSSQKVVSNHGEGLSNSASVNRKVVEPLTVRVSTPGNPLYSGEEDSAKVLTGPGDGDYASAAETYPPRWGWTAPSGSRIEVDDSSGSENITLVHHTGASVVIDPDGSVYITSASKRGGGAAAPYGDYFISAGGDIVIRGGGSISVDTPGDLNLNVGGTLTIRSESLNIITKVKEEVVDGYSTRNVTNDESVIIGGNKRQTIAGDYRTQISGNRIDEVGKDHTVKIDGLENYNVGKKQEIKVGEDQNTSVKGKLSVAAEGDADYHTKANYTMRAGGESKITSAGEMQLASEGKASLNGESSTVIKSGGRVALDGSSVTSRPPIDKAEFASESLVCNIADKTGSVNVIEPPTAGFSSAGSHSAPKSPDSPAEAEIMDAKDIVDNLTSARKFPEYPGNGVLETSNVAGLGKIAHDQMPQAKEVYDEYSGGNSGNVNPPYAGGDAVSISDEPVNRDPNIAPVDPDISVPSRHELNVKISKYFTLGQIVNGTTTNYKPDQGKWEQCAKYAISLANNVLDPIKEKFPSILVTSWYRTNSPNHITGRAIDIVAESRSPYLHAEIARFAWENLPCDQIFLEKNDSGRTHVHLRLATGKGKPNVMTCSDPECKSSVPGIKVEHILRKGTR